MPVIKGLEWTFDTVASTYEKLRPGYVKELYQALFDYIPIGEESNVVEVGSGGGQATAPILNTGCRLTAVEYGEHFSKLLKDKFQEYPDFSIITGKFEDVEFEENTFDLVFSASAFHWIPEKIGYEKVFSMLKHGGVFARFANHPYQDKGNPELSKVIDDLYDEYYNKFHNKKRQVLTEYTEEQAKERAMIASKYGFTDIRYALFHRERVFSAKEYIQLLGTYSDHIAIEETIRTKFFAKIEDAINNHGGKITIYDTIDLQLARKPKNIVLIGFMGSGKTTVGERLAKKLQLPVEDTDQLIEAKEARSISDIFAKDGEGFFRELETRLLQEISQESKVRVLSVGGGTPVRPENHKLIKQCGQVVYLRVRPETVYERVKTDNSRPLLQCADPLAKIRELLASREDAYSECADIIVDVDEKSVEQIAEEIMEKRQIQ